MSVLDILRQDENRENGKVEGVALGVVTDIQDPEKMGRIRVRYPWREDNQNSYWARPAVPYAGKNRGTYFIPEVGDEVLLAFDKGNIEHPYMLGVLWNGQDTPPDSNSNGKNDTKLIRTRTGHEIRLMDAQGKESVEVKTQGGHSVKMDDTSGSANITVKDSSGSNTIVIDTTQNSITIQSSTSLSIKSQTISIEAGASMTIKAGATLTIQGALVQIN
jgi:uncharacterized protein involved in type VI secretion and phage assembly